jgi:tRNA (cytidine/uridine-2'-O-)-methyltransferase
MRLAAFQPENPMNVGALIRLCACFGSPLHIIEPCGFPFSPKAVRGAALDYIDQAEIIRHDSWARYLDERPAGRLILLTTLGEDIWQTRLELSDTLLLGRESSGAPEEVHAAADLRVRIPLAPTARSLNMAMAAAIALAEASRQAIKPNPQP